MNPSFEEKRCILKQQDQITKCKNALPLILHTPGTFFRLALNFLLLFSSNTYIWKPV